MEGVEEKLEEEVKAELEPKAEETKTEEPKAEESKAQKPEKKRTLQWVKGDKIGNVETVAKDDGQWLTFDGGGRISKALLGEYMMDVAEGTLSADELQLMQQYMKSPVQPNSRSSQSKSINKSRQLLLY